MQRLALVMLSVMACSGDNRPAQEERPTKPSKCDEAIAVWVSIPPTGTFDVATVTPAIYQLSNRDVFASCDNAALEKVVPVAIGFLDDKRVVSDSRGGDGSLYLLRHAAKAILERLTGKQFGAFYIDHQGMAPNGPAPDTQEDPGAVPGSIGHDRRGRGRRIAPSCDANWGTRVVR